MISFAQARENIIRLARAHSVGTERVDLSFGVGRICASDIHAPRFIQPFDNAAMDGFAVASLHLKDASEKNPVILPVSRIIAAGDNPTARLTGGCIRIMTGAPIPEGCDAVVPFEEAIQKEDGKEAVFSKSVPVGMHVRRAGEDFREGDRVLIRGDLIQAKHILPLATLGIGSVEVFRRPRVAFLATGKELVDDLAQPLQPGQIYNGNRPFATAMLEVLGCDVICSHTVADNPQEFRHVLEKLVHEAPDIIASSGAVSAGDHDFVRHILEEMGAGIIHHRVKMKPGKPNLLAQFPDGSLYFGLPGNPVATAVGLRFFVYAAIRALTGQKEESPIKAKIGASFRKKAGLHMWLKGKVDMSTEGICIVMPLDGQESFRVSPFIDMNAWIEVGEDEQEISQGEVVKVYPFDPVNA